MGLREHIHKRQWGELSRVVGEHRDKNGDARPDDKNANQRHNRNQRADHKAVATQPFEAG